jgi:S-adenosylmethionine-diacylglycerol 3-amino-3-carboxypropyl transferase
MSSLKQRAYDAWFRHVHGSRLIYNTCWEDPRADRALLGVGRGAAYRDDHQRRLQCARLSARRSRARSIASTSIRARTRCSTSSSRRWPTLAHEDLFALFGEGATQRLRRTLPLHELRRRLAPASAAFWDRHPHWFDGRGRGSFYFRGAAGRCRLAGCAPGSSALRPRLRRDLLAAVRIA